MSEPAKKYQPITPGDLDQMLADAKEYLALVSEFREIGSTTDEAIRLRKPIYGVVQVKSAMERWLESLRGKRGKFDNWKAEAGRIAAAKERGATHPLAKKPKK